MVDVPCRRTGILRNPVELFLTVTLTHQPYRSISDAMDHFAANPSHKEIFNCGQSSSADNDCAEILFSGHLNDGRSPAMGACNEFRRNLARLEPGIYQSAFGFVEYGLYLLFHTLPGILWEEEM